MKMRQAARLPHPYFKINQRNIVLNSSLAGPLLIKEARAVWGE
jgi:hypothetical protein